MMTILSFLGGTAFRLIFGEIAAFFSKKQAHAQEIERMRLQDQIDAGQHARNDAFGARADHRLVQTLQALFDAERRQQLAGDARVLRAHHIGAGQRIKRTLRHIA